MTTQSPRRRAATSAVAVAAAAAVLTSCGSDGKPNGPTGANAYSVDVDAGGPYQGTVGKPIRLEGKVVLRGQEKAMADLQTIGEALLRYRDTNGAYPPAALTDASGKALLSWRVLLLPELGQDALFKKFDLTKAWDDPANKALLDQMPEVYKAEAGTTSTDTGYAGVAGAKALFPKGGAGLGAGVKTAAVEDGPEMTIAIGPVGSKVHVPWTSPGDIDTGVEQHFGSPTGFSGHDSGATPMLFADGSVFAIPNTVTAGSMQSWTSIADGGCTPPAVLAANLGASWDVDGSGYGVVGASTTFTPTKKGTSTIRLRGVNSSGKATVRTAKLVVA